MPTDTDSDLAASLVVMSVMGGPSMSSSRLGIEKIDPRVEKIKEVERDLAFLRMQIGWSRPLNQHSRRSYGKPTLFPFIKTNCSKCVGMSQLSTGLAATSSVTKVPHASSAARFSVA